MIEASPLCKEVPMKFMQRAKVVMTAAQVISSECRVILDTMAIDKKVSDVKEGMVTAFDEMEKAVGLAKSTFEALQDPPEVE